MADKLRCCQPGCDAYMAFGMASPTMRHRGEREMLETMAEMVGWQRALGDGWLCREHGRG